MDWSLYQAAQDFLEYARARSLVYKLCISGLVRHRDTGGCLVFFHPSQKLYGYCYCNCFSALDSAGQKDLSATGKFDSIISPRDQQDALIVTLHSLPGKHGSGSTITVHQ